MNKHGPVAFHAVGVFIIYDTSVLASQPRLELKGFASSELKLELGRNSAISIYWSRTRPSLAPSVEPNKNKTT